MKITSYLMIVFSLAIGFSCKDEDETPPKVETIQATGLSVSKALFKGMVVNTGSSEVRAYGFVYSISKNPELLQGKVVTMESKAKEGPFEKEVVLNFSQVYADSAYVRSFITNENGTVYGKVLSFKIARTSIGALSPLSGKKGDKLTISGANFTEIPGNYTVKFDQKEAKIVEVTSTKIVVEVPELTQDYYSSTINVYLISDGVTKNITSYFKYVSTPSFSDFSPKSGVLGSSIVIRGKNLSSNSQYTIKLGDITLAATTNWNSELYATIPYNASSENLKISVTMDGENYELPGEFKILAPSITGLSNTSGYAGSSLTINGNNFVTGTYYLNGENKFYTTIKMGDTKVAIQYTNYGGSFTVKVPESLSAGTYKVSLSTGLHNATATQEFNVIEPSVTGFSPTSGAPQTQVTITGTNFSPDTYYNTVTFGTIQASVISATSSTLVVQVPEYVSSGAQKVTVKTGGKTLVAGNDFTVIPPSITDFEPALGVPGTLITINGSGFSTYKSNNVVQFGTVATEIVSATANKLVVKVPSLVPAGAMKISVKTYNISVVSTQDFTITN